MATNQGNKYRVMTLAIGTHYIRPYFYFTDHIADAERVYMVQQHSKVEANLGFVKFNISLGKRRNWFYRWWYPANDEYCAIKSVEV